MASTGADLLTRAAFAYPTVAGLVCWAGGIGQAAFALDSPSAIVLAGFASIANDSVTLAGAKGCAGQEARASRIGGPALATQPAVVDAGLVLGTDVAVAMAAHGARVVQTKLVVGASGLGAAHTGTGDAEFVGIAGRSGYAAVTVAIYAVQVGGAGIARGATLALCTVVADLA